MTSPRRVLSPRHVVLALLLGLVWPGPVAAQDAAAEIKAHYTKYEYRIPMRDGVRLFTSVLAPKDSSTTYPILLTRTPFGVSPYGPDEYGEFTLQTQAILFVL